MPDPEKYVDQPEDSFSARVAGKLFIRNDLRDTFYQRILQSAIKPGNSYVYSDLDFIFLGKVIEKVSGMKLNEYMATHFYNPMRLGEIAFLPNNRFTAERIVASTYEKGFRNQLLKGDVHDPGAAIMGGVSGHAGLFGSAAAIAALMQMLLDTGVVNGNQYLQKNTIQLFSRLVPFSAVGLIFALYLSFFVLVLLLRLLFYWSFHLKFAHRQSSLTRPRIFLPTRLPLTQYVLI
jgi:CubicO group peptidase (beta-lactamase class C family)